MYYVKTVDTYTNDIKKTWSVINEGLNRNSKGLSQNVFVVEKNVLLLTKMMIQLYIVTLTILILITET